MFQGFDDVALQYCFHDYLRLSECSFTLPFLLQVLVFPGFSQVVMQGSFLSSSQGVNFPSRYSKFASSTRVPSCMERFSAISVTSSNKTAMVSPGA